MGSIGLAAALAKVGFVALIVAAVIRQEIGTAAIIAFAAIGVALWVGLPIVAEAIASSRQPLRLSTSLLCSPSSRATCESPDSADD